jgi:CHAD domain-containing protein
MSTTATQKPHTFRGPEEAGAPAVAGLPGVRHDDVSPVTVLETERYDTDDLRLAAAGITLAVVRGAEPATWQLDLPDGERHERIRVPVTVDTPAGGRVPLPAEIAELVRGAARKHAVRPVAMVRTLRTEHTLLGADDQPLATVVHDHVTLSTMGRATEVVAWTEMTVEARDDLLDTIEGRVREAGMRPASPRADAELDRVLRPARARRPRLPTSSAGGALMAYVAEQADRMAAEDLRVRRGDPDSVHQLRVAARRMRSALQGHEQLLDTERTEPVVDGLRELGRALAPARDAEVLRERVLTGLAELPDTLRMGNAAALATRYFARAESEGVAAALTALDSADNARLRDAIDALLVEPPLLGRAVRPARKELPRYAAKAARRLEKAVAHADGDAAIHTARKAAKRLRYVVEIAEPSGGKPAKRFRKAVKTVQQSLGEHQDAVVSRDALRTLGAMAHTEDENGFSFGVLLGRDAATAAAIEAGLPQLWQDTWTKKNRRWLTARS